MPHRWLFVIIVLQGSHGHGKSWKKLLSWKSLGIWKFPKNYIMESGWMSWKSHGITCSHGYGSFLVCDCRAYVVRHNHNHIWNYVRMGVMERSKSVMEKSWNSVFRFLWEPYPAHLLSCLFVLSVYLTYIAKVKHLGRFQVNVFQPIQFRLKSHSWTHFPFASSSHIPVEPENSGQSDF